MADDRPQSVDQFASAQTPADHDETNWGEDWESAFQAEDDAFFSEEKEEDFFLEENEPTVTAGVAAQNLDSSLEKTLSGIPDQQVASGALPTKALFGAGSIAALFLSARTAAQKQFIRLQSFPLFVRIPLYALPFLLVGILFALSGAPKPSPLLTRQLPSRHSTIQEPQLFPLTRPPEAPRKLTRPASFIREKSEKNGPFQLLLFR